MSEEMSSPVESTETTEPSTEETAPEGTEEVTEVTPEIAAEAEPVIEKKKFKGKIDGAEVELEATEAELYAAFQKEKASQKRFAEANEIMERVENFASALQQNPIEALISAGVYENEDKLLEAIVGRIQEKLNEPELTEEQKAARAAKEEAEKYKSEVMNLKREQYVAKYQTEFPTALKESGIPVNTRTLADLAYVMKTALENEQDITAAEAASAVREYYRTTINSTLADLGDESLLDYLDEPNLERIRKIEIAKYKTAKPAVVAAKPGTPAPKVKPESGLSADDEESVKMLREKLKHAL